MKLMVLTSEYPFGRGEGFLRDELVALHDAGHSIVVAPMRWRGKQLRDDLPVEIGMFPYLPPSGGRGLTWRGLARAVKALWMLLSDVKHLARNLTVVPVAIRIALYALESGVDHIHAHWLSTSSTAAVLASRISGIPFSITAHRWDIFDNNLGSQKARRAAFVRFIAEAGMSDFIHRNGPIGRRRVLHMGVQVPDEVPSVCNAPILRLACPANLIPIKGHSVLLEALSLAARETDVELQVWGSGPLLPSLQDLASTLGLAERVQFTGALERAEILRRYSRGEVDGVVLASEHEGIPVSLMEAMSNGLPVVATEVGGIPELVRHRTDGLLVPPGNPIALATALLELADSDYRSTLGSNARERIIEQFDVTKIARELSLLFVDASAVDEDTSPWFKDDR